MKVRELITKLQIFDPDLDVFVYAADDGVYDLAVDVEIDQFEQTEVAYHMVVEGEKGVLIA